MRSLINRLASLCFGVYLIHDGELLRIELWKRIQIDMNKETGMFSILSWSFIVVGVIFICGCLIESIRKSIETVFIHFIETKRRNHNRIKVDQGV